MSFKSKGMFITDYFQTKKTALEESKKVQLEKEKQVKIQKILKMKRKMAVIKKNKRDAEELSEVYSMVRFYLPSHDGANIYTYIERWTNPWIRRDRIMAMEHLSLEPQLYQDFVKNETGAEELDKN